MCWWFGVVEEGVGGESGRAWEGAGSVPPRHGTRRQLNKTEIHSQKAHPLRNTIRRPPRLRRLNLARIQLANYRPRKAVIQRNHKNANHNHPSCDAMAGMHAAGSVQRADQEHAGREDDAAGDSVEATGDAVDEEDGGDGDGEH